MTIQDLGSVGELVAAVATVATLIYLSVQIRQNSRLVAASISASTRDSSNENARILASSTAASHIYRSGIEDRGALDPDEQQRFDSMIYLAFTNLNQQFDHGNDISKLAGWFLVSPGVCEWWEVYSVSGFPDDFAAEIERIRESQPVAAQQSAAADSARSE